MTDDRIAQLVTRRDQFIHFLRARGFESNAEDILQASFLRLVERGVTVRENQKLTNWFYTVLRNAALDDVRACKRRARLDHVAASETALQHGGDGEQGDLCAVLSKLTALEPAYREVLECAYIEGLSLAAIAQRRGITRNAATVRLHRARRALALLVREAEARETGEPLHTAA
jgi:RNA polymerase sigma-70 factor, ECF subfamily